MYVAATQYILGIRPELNGLLVNPCIPKEWPGYEVTRKFRNGNYRIIVNNKNKSGYGVKETKVDGIPVETNLIPAFSDKAEHVVEIILV